MKQTTIILLTSLLAIITRPQAANAFNANANFEGDFDSMNHINPSGEQKPAFTDIDDEEGEGGEAEEEQDMLDFSEYMADFLPD